MDGRDTTGTESDTISNGSCEGESPIEFVGYSMGTDGTWHEYPVHRLIRQGEGIGPLLGLFSVLGVDDPIDEEYFVFGTQPLRRGLVAKVNQ
jgi:hypothetical protein